MNNLHFLFNYLFMPIYKILFILLVNSILRTTNLLVFFSPSEKNNLSFIETSALDTTNVEAAFQQILTGKFFFFSPNFQYRK